MDSLFFVSAARSSVGLIRNGNEDGALTHPQLIAVADGMGGHAGGEVASSIALHILARRASVFMDAEMDQDSADDFFNATIEDIDIALKKASDEDPALSGLGTTLTALFIRNNQVALLHVGDSRAYRIRGASIEQLSVDHTVMQELLAAGTITETDIAEHPQRSMLTQALMGTGTLSIGLHIFDLKDSDRFILCSDGLSGVLSDKEIKALVKSKSPEEAVADLIDATYINGAPDNVTVVIADLVTNDMAADQIQFFGTAAS
ncbi:MAG: PP2C family protein-serine/threonine phosphatase [Candidatus Planktophila sp.]